MPILLLFIGLFLPRVVALILWLFSDWFTTAFDQWLIPLLGFLFLPYTLLWYSVVINMYGGVWGLWQIVFMGIALVLDLSSYSSVRGERV